MVLPLLLTLGASSLGQTKAKPIAPAMGTYTLYVVVATTYVYHGVLDMRSKSEYGFKSHPKNPLKKGKYEFKHDKVRFLTGPYSGVTAEFTYEFRANHVEMFIKSKKNPDGVHIVGKRDAEDK